MNVFVLKGPSVAISASPDEWELYAADQREGEQTRDFVADNLNKSMARIIANAPTRKQVSMMDIQMLLRSYSAWGAADTEGYAMVDQILNKVYGE
jgi:hypothetical protein